MSATTLRANAKLTLTLRVTGTRDDGYHLIDAEMVALELHDVLTISPGDSLEAVGPFSAGMPTDDSNLVRKALRLAGRTAAVRIDKQIPHGGGLGGGSADAAAVLRWAGFEDLGAASRLGADIPFCLVGGRARVRGIGEIVDPLAVSDEQFTLVVPPFGCSTPAVYRAWDELGGPEGASGNDLEPAAIALEPRLAVWRQRIIEASGVVPTLAGSGATWFVRGAHPEMAEALPEATVVVTRTDRP
ncbi:MAG: 4-(cytidine 5'-diphospho)-2-C-methyl-D-erythritol kinase [Acidimicrobiia bacterium]